MLPAIPLWLAACATLVPAALKWWWGRSLARRGDDPLLPERLQAHRRRTSVAFLTVSVLLVVGSPHAAVALVLLTAVLHAAAGYPLRRALYEETWSLGSYLWFFTRLIVAISGLWALLAVTPWIVAASGDLQLPVAVMLALILVAWNQHATLILRRLLRARPIADADLLARFDSLVAATRLPRPHFEYVAMNGGMLANAVALPSLDQPGVLFTDALLSRLTADEAAAICAHEVAHLEYYDPRRLRRRHASTLVLIAAAAALGPLSREAFASFASTALVVWPAILLVTLVLRARHRQENETASDLRAVALTGNAEALASGLMKLHTIARVPRRWDQQRERQASHPSLARRIRDIRAHAQTPHADMESPLTFRSGDGLTAVTFESARVSWQPGPGITLVLAYDALVELRLHVAGSAPPALVAVDRRGQRWQMTPQGGDLAALQQVLDRVDSRLTRDLPPAPRLSLVTRGRTIIVWVAALMAVQFLLSFVALNGAGLGGDPFSQPIAIAGVLIVIACAGMGFAWLRRRTGAGLRWSVAAVGIFGVVAVLTVMADMGRATALNRDLVIAPAVEAHVLDAPPAAVFELPFDAQAIRLSPHGRLVALVRRGGSPVDARANRVFTIAGARGVVADIAAEDVAFVDDTHVIALTMRNGSGEVSTVDVASGTRDWRQRLAGIRSGSLTYRSAVNAWIVLGRDDGGQLLRVAGTVGGTDFSTLTWPAPADAGDIDAWAATVAGTVAVQNHTDGRTFARIWIAPRSGNPIATVMPNTTCAVDVAIDRRLLCATQAGTATRIFAVDGDTGAWSALASIDGPFRPGEQAAAGWLTGSWRGTPAALRLATRDLVVAGPAIDDEAPSLLTVSQTMIATVSSSAGGSRVRVFRRVP